jgi:hypothetical protein
MIVKNVEKENRFSANKRMHLDFYKQSDFLYDPLDIVLLVASRRLCNSLTKNVPEANLIIVAIFELFLIRYITIFLRTRNLYHPLYI